MAASLILINGAISVALRLGMERLLLVASLRTVVQLLLIGLVLHQIFRIERWYLVALLTLAMTLIAGIASVRRTQRRYRGIWLDSILSMWASSWFIAIIALVGIIGVNPWVPQYAIPLLGMILGNTLNGVSLGLDRLGEELDGKRDQVETLLALATRWEAAQRRSNRRCAPG